MKKYEAILFDLDGTLLPMDMNTFMKAYFSNLCGVLALLELAPDKIVETIWAGTKMMVKNDGSRKNVEAFWDYFESTGLCDTVKAKELCDGFYTTDFHRARAATKENPQAKAAVELAHKAADKVVLATNPLFPRDGQLTRMGWVGLEENDFDLITSYESDCFCKPNPRYFLSICERIGVSPENCLMIGNDEREDGYAAKAAGLDTYLVTDCLIASEEYPCETKRGTFADMCRFLEEIVK